MLKEYLYKILTNHHRKQGLQQLRLIEKKLISPEARLAVPFVYRGKGFFKKIEPRQNPMEIEALYGMIVKMVPMHVLEIGTARGGSLYLWTQAANENAVIVSVDLPEGEFGGAYPACKGSFL